MTKPDSYVDPLEHTPLHTLLVQTNRMQELPTILVAVFLLSDAVLAYFSWQNRSPEEALTVALALTMANLVNWGLLIGLRVTRRSFGPDKPSILALATLCTVIVILLGLIGATWWLAQFILLLISILVFYSTWIEPFLLGVTQQVYETPKWSADAPPLRLLQIGDIHVERITPRERILNELIEEIAPDIIVFTGDFVNLSNTNDPEAEKAIREIISEWQAPLGVYCISGTPLVEPLDRVKAFVEGLDNLKLLPNQWITVKTPSGALNILGLVVTHDMDRDRDLLKRMMLTAPKTGLHLLLMHPPDIAPEANELGIDLYLCGHTHGGQIRLPFYGALFSSSHLGSRFIMGRYELGTTTLYTARGVGLEGLGAPRARFLCPPEIVLWEIRGK